MAKLLSSQDSANDVTPVVIQGHLVMMEPNSRGQCKQPLVNHILSWIQAYSCFMAVLLASESTSKEEAAGLAAHMHLIIQLSKDLEGIQWLVYDHEFCEWAAAKGVKTGRNQFLNLWEVFISPQTSCREESQEPAAA